MAGWHRWVFVGIHFPDKPTRLKFILELLATTAIFLGVAGEFWAGVEIAYINGQLRGKNADLRSKSRQLVALVEEEAGTASDSAQKARDAAKQAWEYAAWRKISDKQAEIITTRLASLKGHAINVFLSYSQTQEPIRPGRLLNACEPAHSGCPVCSDVQRTSTVLTR